MQALQIVVVGEYPAAVGGLTGIEFGAGTAGVDGVDQGLEGVLAVPLPPAAMGDDVGTAIYSVDS